MLRATLLSATLLFTAAAVRAAEPVRIGITTVLSGPTADRGQSEQYGAQLALDQINEAGGVLGRPIEAFYADNACKLDVGIPGTKRLIEQAHVPVLIGALCTPVTHAILPVVQAAKVPLVIATSAGQDFVDASGAGGNDYAFKTIPSEVDIARGLVRWLKTQGLKSVAVTATEILLAGFADFPTLLQRLKVGAPDVLLTSLGGASAGFFKAYEASGWTVPVSGRVDFAAALGAVSPGFRAAGGLSGLSGIAVFSTLVDRPGVRDFVAAYQAHYGLVPTQRSFFVYEATYLVVDAIRRAGVDEPAAIEAALKTTTMESRLGGAMLRMSTIMRIRRCLCWGCGRGRWEWWRRSRGGSADCTLSTFSRNEVCEMGLDVWQRLQASPGNSGATAILEEGGGITFPG